MELITKVQTPEEIVTAMRQMKELCEVFLEWAKSDEISARMIKDDTANLYAKKNELIRQNDEIKKANDELSKRADSIIDTAKEEAEKILVKAREDLVEAARMKKESAALLESSKTKAYVAGKRKEVAV